MWQNKFESRLDLEPKPSRYLLSYLVILHGLAVTALLQPLILSEAIRLALLLAVLASLLWHVGQHYRDSRRIIQLIWRTDGEWDCRTKIHELSDLSLLPSSYITRYLIVLSLQSVEGRRFRVLLLPDSLPRDQWHLLWLRLRYAKPFRQERVTRGE